MARKKYETRYQMDGKIYTQLLYDKIIPEDVANSLSLHQAATYKLDRAPSRKELDMATKMYLVRLNLEI
jgi:hypothetical protein